MGEIDVVHVHLVKYPGSGRISESKRKYLDCNHSQENDGEKRPNLNTTDEVWVHGEA
jgi:hypothetical protein